MTGTKTTEKADQLLESKNINDLQELQKNLLENPKANLTDKLAVKLAISKLRLRDITETINLDVVFALYKEHNRIKSKTEHPHGENFILEKISQLNWLTDSNSLNWSMILVDDGCPECTGKIAESIIETSGYKEKIKVLYLEDAIKNNHPAVQPLKNVSQSRKGGSILYGLYEAHKHLEGKQNSVIIYTDADLSTHLGQAGLLIHEIISNNYNSAIGSRRKSDSVAVKQEKRNTRGKLFIYLWKRLLKDINYITDTQCGFKAFKADLIKDIATESLDKRFAFDIELLIRVENIRHNSIKSVGVVWVDSEAESTTPSLSPYLETLKTIVKIYRKYSTQQSIEGNEFADFIEKLTEAEWQILVENIPEEIASKDPSTFNTYNSITTSDLKERQ